MPLVQVILSGAMVFAGVGALIFCSLLCRDVIKRFPGGTSSFGSKWEPEFIKFQRMLDEYEKMTGDKHRRTMLWLLNLIGILISISGAILFLNS